MRRGRPADIGRARARELALRFGRDLRVGRITAGLTQRALARLAKVSQQEVSDTELGDPGVSVEVRCRLAAACGHELGWKLYPVASVRLRDSGQLSFAEAIIGAAAPTWQAAIEEPVSPGDGRAADVVLRGASEVLHIEIERQLVDVQAQTRSAQLKREELARQTDRPVRLVIAVPDRMSTRRLVAAFPEVIGRTFPVSSAAIWRALRNGTPVRGDGILFVRPDRVPTGRPHRAARTAGGGACVGMRVSRR